MALIHRRELLRSLVAGGLAANSAARIAIALDCKQANEEYVVIGKQTGDIRGFDPHLNSSASAAEIIGNLYETLVTLEHGLPVDCLAEKWTRAGSTWNFVIRQNRKFASGNLITAADAAFSLQRSLWINGGPAHPLANLGLTAINAKDRILAVKTQDEDLLTMDLPGIADNIVLHCLTSAVCSILDSKLVGSRYSPDLTDPDNCRFAPLDHGEAWLRFNSAGSGPFQIENAVRTDEIVLQRNCYHSDNIKWPGRQPLIVRDIPDPREQQRLLQCGEIQVAWNVAIENAPACSPAAQAPKQTSTKTKKPPAEMTVSCAQARANLLMLCMNTSRKPLSDGDIRKGIRQAIDNKALESSLDSPRWKGQSRFFPSAMTGYHEADASTHCNFTAAESALADQKCILQLDYLVGAGRSGTANWLARELAKFKINLSLKPASSGRIFQERLERRDYDLALVPLGSDFLHPQANAQALCNNSAWEDLNDFDGPHTLAWYCHWRDDDIMKDVAEAARAPDSSAQQQSYDKIQKKLFERGPYAFLLDEVAYVKGKGSLPVIGALDNQTRYSPLKQT